MLCAAGCANDEPFVSDRATFVFPEMDGAFEEDVSARKGHDAPPPWLYHPERYAGARPGRVYFVGYGLPRATLQAARDSAIEDAQRLIVRYMGTTVGVKTERAGTAVGDTRGGSYEAVTDRILSSTVARDTVNQLYVRDFYAVEGVLVQDLVKRRIHRAYVLAEFGAPEAKAVAEQAEAAAEREIETLEQKRESSPGKVLDERDRTRLDSLKKLRKKLDNLGLDDFKL
jgi:hypothetical protein